MDKSLANVDFQSSVRQLGNGAASLCSGGARSFFCGGSGVMAEEDDAPAAAETVSRRRLSAALSVNSKSSSKIKYRVSSGILGDVINGHSKSCE